MKLVPQLVIPELLRAWKYAREGWSLALLPWGREPGEGAGRGEGGVEPDGVGLWEQSALKAKPLQAGGSWLPSWRREPYREEGKDSG